MAGVSEGPKRPPPPPPRGPRFEPVDREKTCPLLLRVFTKIGGHHANEDFAVRGKEPKDEVQIYTWKDATLREITDLVKEVAPAARRRNAKLSFAFVYPDKHGRFLVREVGKTFSYGNGRLDDNKALAELGFQIGDYLDVAIFNGLLEPYRDRLTGKEKNMADKLIKEMGLPKSMANVFAARNITTAQEALALTDFELMLLLDVGMAEVSSALARISEIACPPYQTALALMEQRIQKEGHGGHLPTGLKGLDEALCGGIPFGVLTELVGPAGIGKTQFCMKLSLLASLPTAYGGLNGRVIYIDVESKFSSRRIIEIGVQSFPDIFNMKGMAQEMAGRILVLRPTSLSKFTESLQQIQVALRQQQVKLVVIDSMTAVISGDYGQGASRQHLLGWHVSFIKSLAEFSRIPIVVTNQVRSQTRDEGCQYSFQVRSTEDPVGYDSHLVAALGINWAHSVTIRLVLEAKSGQRFIKLAKSPMSPPLAFPFNITGAGISLLDDYGRELKGAEINKIHSHGHSDVINFDGKVCSDQWGKPT